MAKVDIEGFGSIQMITTCSVFNKRTSTIMTYTYLYVQAALVSTASVASVV